MFLFLDVPTLKLRIITIILPTNRPEKVLPTDRTINKSSCLCLSDLIHANKNIRNLKAEQTELQFPNLGSIE